MTGPDAERRPPDRAADPNTDPPASDSEYDRAYRAELDRQRQNFFLCADSHWECVVAGLREVHAATKDFHSGEMSQWRYAAILRSVANLVDIPEASRWVEAGRRRAQRGDAR